MNKVSFRKVCEDYGIRLHTFQSAEKYMKMVGLDPSKSSGYAVYQNRPIILFDDKRPIEEVRFTVAHELGHILLGHLSYRQENGEIPEWAEREADSFASIIIANEILCQYSTDSVGVSYNEMKHHAHSYTHTQAIKKSPAEKAEKLAAMCSYIDDTKGIVDRYYQITRREVNALVDMSRCSVVDALCLAFDYGRAKGYRAARNRAKKERSTLRDEHDSLIVLPVPEAAGRFRKREDDFFEISRKIRRAWGAMGYAGDPIIELMTALQGMYVWASK